MGRPEIKVQLPVSSVQLPDHGINSPYDDFAAHNDLAISFDDSVSPSINTEIQVYKHDGIEWNIDGAFTLSDPNGYGQTISVLDYSVSDDVIVLSSLLYRRHTISLVLQMIVKGMCGSTDVIPQATIR